MAAVFIKPSSQRKLIEYINSVLQAHRTYSEIRSKMEQIDISYARYQATQAPEDGNAECCNVFDADNIVAPIVVSQVDSMVAYLADVFLSGYPLFPVVSTPSNRKWAEQLETLLDDHATVGGYARQLLLFLRNAVKYNVGAVEIDWSEMTEFSVTNDFRTSTAQNKVNRGKKSFNRLKALDMYNTIWDYNVAPGDVSLEGDYAGYIEVMSRTKLKRLINRLTATDANINTSEALSANLAMGVTDNYTIHPQVSDYISARKPRNGVDWVNYMTGSEDKPKTSSGDYEVVTLYARILPMDFDIKTPQPNTPQIWRFRLLNGTILIEAQRIVTAFDALPIVFGQPLEDGLGYQTQSVAESEIPIQEAATTLFNIRFSAARRAVSDRALYDSTAINVDDVNSKAAAPKIPVRPNILNQKGLESYYKAIPFDMRGTETTLQDAAQIVDFSKMLSGLNNARQGQFQKGNKSVTEWNDVMGSSDTRLRLPAIVLEHQAFVPMRAMMVLNIFQFGADTVVVSQKSGEEMDIKLDELRRHVLSFRLADGYSPKSKMASTEMIVQGMNMIAQSEMLQQTYGQMLPAMFAHMMQLGGVRGLDEYSPDRQPTQGPAGLAGQVITTGAPAIVGEPAPAQPADQAAMPLPNPTNPSGV